MNWEAPAKIAPTAQALATSVAVVLGGLWAFWKFVIQRSNEPATNGDIDVRFVGIQDDKWIVEVTFTLNNKSLVRLQYENFQLRLRYFSPGDPITDGGAGINYQLEASTTIDSRVIFKPPEPKPGDKKNKNKQKWLPGRFFHNSSYINPRQTFSHRYITFIPANATFLWVQTKFVFKLWLRRDELSNAQKIFRVPAADAVTSQARLGKWPSPCLICEQSRPWVESGVRPQSILPSHLTGGVADRTRPLCAIRRRRTTSAVAAPMTPGTSARRCKTRVWRRPLRFIRPV